jgi:chromosome segregation ATPase
METNGNINILSEYKRLLALNMSLEARLDDYSQMIKERDNEIIMLQQMLTEANSYRSSLDNEVNELQQLQQSIAQLKQQAEESPYAGTSRHLRAGAIVSVNQQLENLKLQYTSLQVQLSEVQAQCLELNNRNLLLQHNTSRIAELESLLENAEEEIKKLKSRQTIPDRK